MFKKLFTVFVLLAAGFIGGLLLTARLHISNDSLADELRPATAAPRPALAAPAPPTAPQPSAAPAGGPDFTHVAGQAVKGVTNISSLQVERRANSPFASDPFFRYFFGDGGEEVPEERI